MTQEDEFGGSTVLPYITPSKNFNQKETLKVKEYSLQIHNDEKKLRAWGNCKLLNCFSY